MLLLRLELFTPHTTRLRLKFTKIIADKVDVGSTISDKIERVENAGQAELGDFTAGVAVAKDFW